MSSLSGELDNRMIAFTVWGLDHYSGFSEKQPNSYYSVSVNNGGHYNRTNHRFICPYHGLYLFSVTFTSGRSTINQVHLRRNGFTQFQIFTNYFETFESIDSGSTSLILECPENFYVDVAAGTRGNLRPVSNGHIFSGFLLTKL